MGRRSGLCEPKFIEDPRLVKIETVPRSWCERLISWPWRPWMTTRTVIRPDPTIHFDASSMTYIGHPSMLRELRRRTEAPCRN